METNCVSCVANKVCGHHADRGNKQCEDVQERLAKAIESVKIDLKRLALTGIYYQQAVDNVGVYPGSVSGGENPYEKRTERMEGHNDCAIKIVHYVVKIGELVSSSEHKELIEHALLNEYVDIHISEDDRATLNVNCNDLFYWACADAEEIKLEQLPELFKCYEESPKNGDLLWCCRQRKMRPQGPYYKHFSQSEKILFNACGPERKDA